MATAKALGGAFPGIMALGMENSRGRESLPHFCWKTDVLGFVTEVGRIF